VDNDGRTPLYVAIPSGDDDMVEQLIKAGARVNIQVSIQDPRSYSSKAHSKFDLGYANTPLMYAAAMNERYIAEKLLESGADANARNEKGCYVIMFAARTDNLELVQMLIDKGANASVRLNDGRSTIALLGDAYGEMIKLLEKNGAGR
jgi:ankyrin repeat protein